MYPKRGVTFLELILLAAMAAALATVAAPSLGRARTRARIAEAKDGLRAAAVALEAYRIDDGSYPPGGAAAAAALSTPNAYLAGGMPRDPFAARGEALAYLPLRPCRRDASAAVPALAPGPAEAAGYLLQSAGPARKRVDARRFVRAARALEAADFIYDPTNGTVSPGNIWRSGGAPGIRAALPLAPLEEE